MIARDHRPSKKRIKSAFIEDLRARFPGMPENEMRRCAKQFVRNKNPIKSIIPENRVAEIYVRAHIRHTMTPYESVLLRGESRTEARRSVQKEVDETMNKWRAKE